MCLEEGGFSDMIKVKGEIGAAIERTASSEKCRSSGRMAAMMTEKQFQQFMHLIWTDDSEPVPAAGRNMVVPSWSDFRRRSFDAAVLENRRCVETVEGRDDCRG